MRRFVRDIFIVAGIGILICSTSKDIMKWISDRRNDSDAWWGTYQVKHGDLVAMSYLDFVPKFRLVRDLAVIRPQAHCKCALNLFVQGDSFTKYIPDSAYSCLHEFHFAYRFHQNLNFHLDTTQTNVLIIEMNEHHFREYFHDLRIFDEVLDTGAQHGAVFNFDLHPDLKRVPAMAGLDVPQLFNPNINQNLQYNLFNYNFIIPIFEYKAALNYYLFNRASGDVVISNDRNFLFQRQTVEPDDINSSYCPLSDAELDGDIDRLNQIYDHYKKSGFSEVYFSLIPNSATIMQPVGYNKLIPRVDHNKKLRMPVIDVYEILKLREKPYYNPGDTHWNNAGIQEWIKTVNHLFENGGRPVQ